jgi:dTMP kinase
MNILLEGLDGAGKSTLAKKMAKKYGYHEIEAVPEELKPLRKMVEDTNSPSATFFFFALSNLLQGQRTPAKNEKGLIIDRSLYSTLAYHSILLPEKIYLC